MPALLTSARTGASEVRLERPEQPLRGRRVGDVPGQRHRLAPGRLDLGHDRLRAASRRCGS